MRVFKFLPASDDDEVAVAPLVLARLADAYDAVEDNGKRSYKLKDGVADALAASLAAFNEDHWHAAAAAAAAPAAAPTVFMDPPTDKELATTTASDRITALGQELLNRADKARRQCITSINAQRGLNISLDWTPDTTWNARWAIKWLSYATFVNRNQLLTLLHSSATGYWDHRNELAPCPHCGNVLMSVYSEGVRKEKQAAAAAKGAAAPPAVAMSVQHPVAHLFCCEALAELRDKYLTAKNGFDVPQNADPPLLLNAVLFITGTTDGFLKRSIALSHFVREARGLLMKKKQPATRAADPSAALADG